MGSSPIPCSKFRVCCVGENPTVSAKWVETQPELFWIAYQLFFEWGFPFSIEGSDSFEVGDVAQLVSLSWGCSSVG